MQDYIKSLSLKYNLDTRVITEIVNHPLRYMRGLVSGNNVDSVRIKHFGLFAQKRGDSKKRISSKASKKMIDRLEYRYLVADKLNVSEDNIEFELNNMLNDGKYIEIHELYNYYNKVIKRIYRNAKQNKIE